MFHATIVPSMLDIVNTSNMGCLPLGRGTRNWLAANLPFSCQLKQTAPRKESLWKSAERFARSQHPPLVVEAPEEIHSGFTLIAATPPHFQAAVQAVFKPNTGAAAGAAILPGLAPQGQKEILRHIASYLEAAATQTCAGANFDGVKPERLAEGFFQLASNDTPSELLGRVTKRVALAFRQAIRRFAQHQQGDTIGLWQLRRAAQGKRRLLGPPGDVDGDKILGDFLGGRHIQHWIEFRGPSKGHAPTLHSKSLAVITGRATHRFNAAAQDKRGAEIFSDTHITTQLYGRTRALEPDIAGDIYLEIGTHERQREVAPGGHCGRSLPSAQGFGTRPVDARNREFPGLDDFWSAPRDLLQSQARLWHCNAPGDRDRLQCAAGSDVRGYRGFHGGRMYGAEVARGHRNID